MGSVKKEGGQCEGKGKCDDKGELKSYIQFLCTAHMEKNGSHLCFTFKNQRHDPVGTNNL
jgi:hypothetical protein